MLQLAKTTLVDYATVLGGLVAALGLASYARTLLRRTVGRRYDAGRRLTRLGTGAQLAFFEAVLGEPPAMRRRFECDLPDWESELGPDGEPPNVTRTYVESFFMDPLHYVQTVSDEDETVVGFSITTRNRRFRPEIIFPVVPSRRERIVEKLTLGRRKPYAIVRLRLGRTTFENAIVAEWAAGGSPSVRSGQGARSWNYTEIYSFGNPGHYQEIALTYSSVAAPRANPGEIESADAEQEPWLQHDEAPENWQDVAPLWLLNLRSRSPVTTVTVIGMEFPVDEWPQFGPHGDEVRTLS